MLSNYINNLIDDKVYSGPTSGKWKIRGVIPCIFIIAQYTFPYFNTEHKVYMALIFEIPVYSNA